MDLVICFESVNADGFQSVTTTADEVEASAFLQGYVITLNTVAPWGWLNCHHSSGEDMERLKEFSASNKDSQKHKNREMN